jgi:hypothetical protein
MAAPAATRAHAANRAFRDFDMKTGLSLMAKRDDRVKRELFLIKGRGPKGLCPSGVLWWAKKKTQSKDWV